MKFLPISHFIVHGNSMYPTLKSGQHVFTVNWFFKIKIADLVVARVEGRDIIKRVKKMEGGKVFIVGDNEQVSTDSRKFGWIPEEHIVGKVILVI